MSRQEIQEAKNKMREAEAALRVAQDNLEFAKLGARQKRVAIARDVISAIKAGIIDVQHGVYLRTHGNELNDDGYIEKFDSCTACALGSMFATCVVKRPVLSLDVNDVMIPARTGANDDAMREALSPYFSEKQLRLIESAFEMDDFMGADDDVEYDEDDNVRYVGELGRAIAFGERYSSDKNRLIAIMNNIIENNGTFKP